MYVKTPSSIIVSASSNTGKTYWVLKLCESHLNDKSKFFDNPMDEIYYFYNIYNPIFANYKGIKFIKGIGDLPNNHKHILVIYDDFQCEKSVQDKMVKAWLGLGHHTNITQIYLNQTLFHTPQMRLISLNTKIFVLFPTLRDKLSYKIFFRQLDVNYKFLCNIYKDACAKRFHYLVIDLDKSTDNRLRFSTEIFEKNITYYLQPDALKSTSEEVEFYGQGNN